MAVKPKRGSITWIPGAGTPKKYEKTGREETTRGLQGQNRVDYAKPTEVINGKPVVDNAVIRYW